MEDLRLRHDKASKALDTLEAILREPFSLIVRDATVQRFEYTFESVWKLAKVYLKSRKGVACQSPKDCFRQLLAVGVLTEDQAREFLEMTEDRNLTAHTYEEEVAARIFKKAAAAARLMRVLTERLRSDLDVL